jgi:hypothetical protein
MCFSLAWLAQFLVWLVILGAVIAIVRLLVPWLTAFIGIPILGQIAMIVMYAVIAILVIYIVFDLLACLLGFGGSFPRLAH